MKEQKMPFKRVRIVDIAEELGLSTATVSNVIHGKTQKISERTVKKVQELLEERQYIPSMAGILLAQNDSRIIGVVVNNHEKYESHVFEDAFIASSVNCLSAEIERAGYFMMIKAAAGWEEIARFASMWNMEGLILIGFCDGDYRELRNRMHIPFVVYDGYQEEERRFGNLMIDNFDGGRQVANHLRSLGHERALCVSDNDVCVDMERFLGLKEGMAGAAELLLIPMRKAERIRFYRDHLQTFRKFTAVFAVSDYYAVELMQFMTREGICVPEEISVAGFDDTPLAGLTNPALTTVSQNHEMRAQMAVELLLKLKEGETAQENIVLPVTLIVRESTGKCIHTR